MEITEIKIRKFFDDTTNIRAVVSITIDNVLAIHDIKVINKDEKLFLAMPSKKMKSGSYSDTVHPLNAELRNYFESQIIGKYKEELNNLQ